MTEYLDSNVWTRPSPSKLKVAFNHIFRSTLSLSQLQQAAIDGRLSSLSNPNAGHDYEARGSEDDGVIGRSVAWKLFLTPASPLISGAHVVPSVPIAELRTSRSVYVSLATQRLRAPDGSYEEGSEIPGVDPAMVRRTGHGYDGGWEKNNPLSLDAENPWQQWFADAELRKVIRQDVERTFPEIPYFSLSGVRSALSTILFLYCVTHPVIGYRQGMHEVLAPLYFALDYDSLSSASELSDDELLEFCSREWLAADAYTLFEVLMQGAGEWYEWREPQVPSPTALSDGQVTNWVAPIVRVCNRIQEQLLRPVDPALWAHMDSLAVEPQIYGIRWLRLLFTREFKMSDAMLLWDALFAADPTLDLSRWICVAMLLRIRSKLLSSDYSTCLTHLLRYSSPSLPRTPMLVKQALALRANPTPTEGIAIVMENRSHLGISLESSSPRANKKIPKEDDKSKKYAASPEKGQIGLPEIIARSIFDRGEALGINRAVFNTVSEIRRNIPDFQANHSRSQSTQALPLSSPPAKLQADERPPWEPKSRRELEAETVHQRDVTKRLGHAMEWALQALQAGDGNGEYRLEALRCLEHVRDVMLQKTDFVEERLMSAAERQQRDKEKKASNKLLQASVENRTLSADASAAVRSLSGSSRGPPARSTTYLSSRDSKPATSLPRVPHPAAAPIPSQTPVPSLARSSSGSTFPQPSNSAVPYSVGGHEPDITSSSKLIPAHLPPWEHTRSGFSDTSPALAKPLPTLNSTRRSNATQTHSGRDLDPLGALNNK